MNSLLINTDKPFPTKPPNPTRK